MIYDTCNMVARVRANYSFDPVGVAVLGAQTTLWGAGNHAYAYALSDHHYVVGDCYYAGATYVQQPRTRVEIDLNVRVRGNGTFVGFEDVSGPLAVGEPVEVYESESGVSGNGRVTEIDGERELVYLSVDWASLTEIGSEASQEPAGGTQLFYVGAATPNSTLMQGSWTELVPQTCLAAIDAGNGAIWVTAPLYKATDSLPNTLPAPFADLWRTNVDINGAVSVAA